MFTAYHTNGASPDYRVSGIIGFFVWILMASLAFGQGGPGGGNQRSSPSDYYRGAAPPPPSNVLTPHGGQYMATESNFFELVIMPLQTRIYVFDKSLKPQSARDVRVQMSVLVPTEKVARQIAFQYVVLPPGTTDQDYVVAVFDMAQLRGKETPVTLEFSNLPDRKNPTKTFSPVVSRSTIRPYVARVLASNADKDAVLRQRTCPASNEPLGVKRAVVKVLIGDFPLYLCSVDCIEIVRESPEKYLPPPQAVPGQ